MKKYILTYNEHVAACNNPIAEIDNADLNYYCGFNDKQLQGPKKDFIAASIIDGSIHFGQDYDWRRGAEAKVEYDTMMPNYKYCYNARDGHDSLILVYTNLLFPNCVQFDAANEFKHLTHI